MCVVPKQRSTEMWFILWLLFWYSHFGYVWAIVHRALFSPVCPFCRSLEFVTVLIPCFAYPLHSWNFLLRSQGTYVVGNALSFYETSTVPAWVSSFHCFYDVIEQQRIVWSSWIDAFTMWCVWDSLIKTNTVRSMLQRETIHLTFLVHILAWLGHHLGELEKYKV
jgi:hypothetical protein